MGFGLERHRVAAAAGDQGHGDALGCTVFHQGLGVGHRLRLGEQRPHDRLLHRQEIVCADRIREPGHHLLRTVLTAASPQLQQLVVAQPGAEMGCCFSPAAAVQGLGVQQQSIQIEQAGGRRRGQGDHRGLIPVNRVSRPTD